MTVPRPTSEGLKGSLRHRPHEPSDLIVFGFGAAIGGWALAWLVANSTGLGQLSLGVGLLASVVGGLMVLVGAVAAGVRLGMRWAELDRRP
jgi:branched-subunit amino acid ABC-type transport system permease component